MQKTAIKLLVILISINLLGSCSTSKRTLIDSKERPTMKQIHDKKFHVQSQKISIMPSRKVDDTPLPDDAGFVWLPNPTLEIYVFKHLTASGHFVPGYSTYFRMYKQHHIALPSELNGWE